MTDPDQVHLSRVHSGAVCEEIGERLSLALGPHPIKLPPALLALIGQLAKGENGDQNFAGLDA